MNIERLLAEQKLKQENALLKKQINQQIKNSLDFKQSRQIDNQEVFKPVIKAQKETKQTIDEKQDRLIEQLNKNQSKLINAVDTLNETLTMQGSKVDIQDWLDDQPNELIEVDPLYKDTEDDDQNGALFNEEEIEILNSFDFDPSFKENPDKKVVLKEIQRLNGRSRSSNKVISDRAKNEKRVLTKYYQKLKIQPQSGKGIMNHASYKVKNNKYGQLFINIPRLMNEHVIHAIKNGQTVYEDVADKSLIDLLTKRFDPKKRYSTKAIKIFNNLNMLAGLNKRSLRGKANLIGGSIIYTNPSDMMKRLTLLTGSKRAGNTSIAIQNEIWMIIDYLLK